MSSGPYSPYRLYNPYKMAPTFRDGHTHQGEHGNLVKDIWPIDILSDYVPGDLILVDEIQWDTTWTSIKLHGEHCPGLEVGLGVRDLDAGVDYPDLFCKDVQPGTIGVAPVATALPANGLTATGSRVHELLEYPFRQHEDLNLGLRAGILVSLGGTVTNGDRFWITTERVFIGNN